MRVAIAGAGAVGRSIAGELLENGHEVLLIDHSAKSIKADSLPGAEWLLADACEIASLDDASLERCNVVICATGDDKVNLVVSLLAKTEYGVPRVVARIYDAKRAEVYERLGIPTIATVPWTTDRLLNALTRDTETTKWRDPTGTVAVAEVALHEDWVGRRATDLETATGARVAFLIRFGTGVLPDPKTVIQAGDQVYIAAISGRVAEALAIAALPPSEDLEP